MSCMQYPHSTQTDSSLQHIPPIDANLELQKVRGRFGDTGMADRGGGGEAFARAAFP